LPPPLPDFKKREVVVKRELVTPPHHSPPRKLASSVELVLRGEEEEVNPISNIPMTFWENWNTEGIEEGRWICQSRRLRELKRKDRRRRKKEKRRETETQQYSPLCHVQAFWSQ